MGIYDREYYRSDETGFLGGLSRRGRACKWLIIANVVAFVVQLSTRTSPGGHMDGWFTEAFVLDVDRVLHGEVWRLLTAGFLHSFEWSHIVFNMLFLWWFGSELEDIYGHREFLGFYLVSLLIGSIAFVISELARHPGGPFASAYGASGAVTAVMVLFATHFPRRTVLLFFIIPVPVVLLVVFNVLHDTLGLLGGSRQTVAFAIHLGGAAFGFLYARYHWRVTTWLPTFSGFRLGRPRPRLRVFHGDSDSDLESPPTRSASDEHIEAELDAVLEKVARFGKSSLSERENRVLMRASEFYRQRRK